MNKKEYEHGNIQKLLVKICFFFKSINLEICLPSERSETVQLLIPKELDEGNKQIGSIQYGGVKYPLLDKNSINLKYVEVRLKGDFLREIDKYNEVYEHGNIQKLLVKICFFFKSINLEICLPSERSETVQLLIPKELDEGNQITSR